MIWEVEEVKVIDTPLSIFVRFKDGTKGKVIFSMRSLYGVFEPLKNPSFFSKVYLDHGVVCWPGEVDLAPDAMHSAIKKNGEWFID